MKLIKLTKGLFAQIDDEDFEYLNQFRWYAHKFKNSFYAKRMSKKINGKQKSIAMHIEIMGFTGIDHADRDGLNNQKYNLRKANKSQNATNIKKRDNLSSIYKGVSWNTRDKKWCAHLGYQNQTLSLGYFDNEKEAAKAYNEKALELFGEFATLNDVEEMKP